MKQDMGFKGYKEGKKSAGRNTESRNTDKSHTGRPDGGKSDTWKKDSSRPNTGKPAAWKKDGRKPNPEKTNTWKKDAGKPYSEKSNGWKNDAGKTDAEKSTTWKPNAGKSVTRKYGESKRAGAVAEAEQNGGSMPEGKSTWRTSGKKKEIHGKELWKPGNMLYPVPAVMVSVRGSDGKTNILTIAWTGTVCSDPAMLYISVRPERHSYQMIKESGEFVVNLTTKNLAAATDYCGVRSGRDENKWKKARLTEGEAKTVSAPIILESPVNIECKVTERKEFGSHHMFIAKVTAVQVDEAFLNGKGKLELNRTGLLAYSHGEYWELGDLIGSFGYSIKKSKRTGESSGYRRKK